jgi:predicted aldo/keto reductase-like oxidoreductase
MLLPPLTDAEQTAIAATADALRAMPRIPCTGCEYCVKGCPMDIPIPDIFDAYNTKTVYNNTAGARRTYDIVTARHGKPDDCIACGKCESACPQKIHIIERLKDAKKELES